MDFLFKPTIQPLDSLEFPNPALKEPVSFSEGTICHISYG